MKRAVIIFILIFINFSSFSPLSAENLASGPTKRYEGLFGMCGGRQPLEKRLSSFERAFQELPWLSGMLVIVEWKGLQPQPDKFDWTEADKLVNLAAKYNRKVSLLFVSIVPPDWIYEQGAPQFTFTDPNSHHRDSYGKTLTVPMPLSDKFYELWSRFIKEAGKRYDSNPTVAAVVIMGVNFQGPETYIRINNREEIERYGLTPENIINYWKKYIDLYMEAFPNTMCCLQIAEMLRSDRSVLDRVVAYGAETYPNHFQIQTDKLDGRKDQEGQREYDLVKKYSSKIAVGFQTVATFRDKERQGSMLMTLMNGIRAGARYYELWTGDATDPAISKAFYDLWQEGEKIGWEKLMERAKAQGEYKTINQDNYIRQDRTRLPSRNPRNRR